MKWDSSTPIYLQLKQELVSAVLAGNYAENDAIPSIRQVAADYRINHITVAKAFQQLVDEGILEKKRGLGMYVKMGARAKLLKNERKRFLEKEWPHIVRRMQQLEIDITELLK